MLNSDYCGQDAVMIDVGINVDDNGKLCGDVDYSTLDGKASAATPVPGGVGVYHNCSTCKTFNPGG